MQRQRLIWFWIQTKIICRDLPAEPPDEFYLYESEGWRRDGGDGWKGGVGRKRVARRGIRPVRKPEACAMSFSLAAEPTKLIFNFLSLIRHGSSYGPLGLYAKRFYCPGGRAYTMLHCFAAVLYCHSKHGTFFLTLSSRPLIAPTSHVRLEWCTATGDHPNVPTWRINSPIIPRIIRHFLYTNCVTVSYQCNDRSRILLKYVYTWTGGSRGQGPWNEASIL